jgi:hypothetical protein
MQFCSGAAGPRAPTARTTTAAIIPRTRCQSCVAAQGSAPSHGRRPIRSPPVAPPATPQTGTTPSGSRQRGLLRPLRCHSSAPCCRTPRAPRVPRPHPRCATVSIDTPWRPRTPRRTGGPRGCGGRRGRCAARRKPHQCTADDERLANGVFVQLTRGRQRHLHRKLGDVPPRHAAPESPFASISSGSL